MRNIVEVSDLGIPAHDSKTSKNRKDVYKTDQELAHRELYRLLEDYEASLSLSFPQTRRPTPSIGPLPTSPVVPVTPAPVIPETPAPVIPETPAPVRTTPETSMAPVKPEETPFPVSASPVSPPVPQPTLVPVEIPSPVAPVSLAPVSTETPAPVITPTLAPVSPSEATRDELILQKCMVTAQARSEGLKMLVSTISNPQDLDDDSTAQYQALDWLDSTDPAIVCFNNMAVVQQRYLAALIYFQLGGSSWTNCGVESTTCVNVDPDVTREPVRWLTGLNECAWFGLFCGDSTETDPELHFDLTGIELPDNNLAGDLPVEIFTITSLVDLIMDGNRGISGTIPAQVEKLTNLQILDLDTNRLSGQLPSELFTLLTLRALDMNDNRLTGTLSGLIGNLKELNVLQLENNLLTGSIPTPGLFLLERMGT
jgi:hypothetical protein